VEATTLRHPYHFTSPRLGILVALGLDCVTKGVAIASLPLWTCQRQATSRGTSTLWTCQRQATSRVAMEPQTMGTPPFVTHSRLPAVDLSINTNSYSKLPHRSHSVLAIILGIQSLEPSRTSATMDYNLGIQSLKPSRTSAPTHHWLYLGF
jgi:hypothetical protein